MKHVQWPFGQTHRVFPLVPLMNELSVSNDEAFNRLTEFLQLFFAWFWVGLMSFMFVDWNGEGF
jgi:hypothetical protein